MSMDKPKPATPANPATPAKRPAMAKVKPSVKPPAKAKTGRASPATRRVVVAVGVAALAGLGAFVVIQLNGAKPYHPPDSRVVQPGAPGQSGRILSPEELARISGPPHTLADTVFIQQMIPHHAQALEMAELARTRAASPGLLLLAERIEVSQTDEIELMRRWLTDRGEPLPQEHTSHAGHEQLGMLNDQQFAELAAARGADFDRLFLTFMIRHHEGAISMVQKLYANGGGLEPASDRFAREVNADQSIEITKMRELLAQL
jgi:uncharacterized protein (DUF305 family)